MSMHAASVIPHEDANVLPLGPYRDQQCQTTALGRAAYEQNRNTCNIISAVLL